MIRDAETGAPLTFTKSKWDAVEGRVNLDYRSIILMGTGAMCIKNTANGMGLSREMLFSTEDEDEDDEHIEGEGEVEGQQEVGTDNPLFQKFMHDGPLNPMAHVRWNPKTGGADPDPRLLRAERRRRQLEEEEAAIRQAELDRLHDSTTQDMEEGDKEVAEGILNLWQGGASGLFSSRSPPQTGASTSLPPLSIKTPPNEMLNASSVSSGSVMHPLLSPGQQSDFSGYSSPDTAPSRQSSSQSNRQSRSKSKGRSSRRSRRGGTGTARSSPIRQRKSPGRSPLKKRGKAGSSVFSLLSGDDRDGTDASGATSGSGEGSALEAAQEYFFKELFHKASQIDRIRNPLPMMHDKSQEERDRITAGDDERRLRLVKHCNELAYMKARNIRDLKRAYDDEERRDRARISHEAEWPPNSVTGKELRSRHAEERQKAKTYLETLQHDNEVLLILKMRQRRLLW